MEELGWRDFLEHYFLLNWLLSRFSFMRISCNSELVHYENLENALSLIIKNQPKNYNKHLKDSNNEQTLEPTKKSKESKHPLSITVQK